MAMVNSNVNPVCCACGELIGAMPLDIYMKAVEHRGEYLFCPDCRKHKCDVCGWFIPTQEMSPCHNTQEGYLGNACETCATFVLPIWMGKDDFSHFRTMQPPNLQYMQFHTASSELETRWDER